MKRVEDVTACIIDYGTFISIAEKLGETMKKVYYHSPIDREYQDVRDCIKGDGLDYCERLDEPLDPQYLKEIDLFVFPDIAMAGLQQHLRDMGKAVWGSLGATDLELYRTYFLDVLKAVNLPTIHAERIVGLTNLAAHLKKVKNKWIKIDRFRANMETWHHLDWNHSQRTLDALAVIFGGAKESVVFIVQDDIDSEMEVGYDGWCVDGQFPAFSFQGYEKKNELYLGSVLPAADLPDEIKLVNKALSPVLKEYGYRNWWATEIRIAKDVPYFIDPTPRMPGQTGEHQLESCANFAEMVWAGANGVLIEPDFQWQFAAEATLHYDNPTKDDAISEEWKTLHLPEKTLPWLKLYHYCRIDGVHHFMSQNTDEVGVCLGVGDTIEEAIQHLKDNLDTLKELPVHARTGGFASLLESIKEAEKNGIPFGGKIPPPATILKLA